MSFLETYEKPDKVQVVHTGDEFTLTGTLDAAKALVLYVRGYKGNINALNVYTPNHGVPLRSECVEAPSAGHHLVGDQQTVNKRHYQLWELITRSVYLWSRENVPSSSISRFRLFMTRLRPRFISAAKPQTNCLRPY